VELREILLRDKPAAFLEASPKGTVPVLVLDGLVMEESRDVMDWALAQADPERLLEMADEGFALLDACDGPFKAALDRTKYHTRYGSDPETERAKAYEFLSTLQARLAQSAFLMGARPTLADIAIFPFVRQFANADRARFEVDMGAELQTWLDHWLNHPTFQAVMTKYAVWQPGTVGPHLVLGQNTPA